MLYLKIIETICALHLGSWFSCLHQMNQIFEPFKSFTHSTCILQQEVVSTEIMFKQMNQKCQSLYSLVIVSSFLKLMKITCSEAKANVLVMFWINNLCLKNRPYIPPICRKLYGVSTRSSLSGYFVLILDMILTSLDDRQCHKRRIFFTDYTCMHFAYIWLYQEYSLQFYIYRSQYFIVSTDNWKRDCFI